MPDPDTAPRPADPTTLPLFNPAPPPGPRPAAALRLAAPTAGTAAPPVRHNGELSSLAVPPDHLLDGEPPPDLPPAAHTGITVIDADTVRIDWALVRAFRSQASDQLSAALAADRHLDRGAQQELGRAIITELLQSAAAENLSTGRDSWSLTEQDALAQAIFDALFRLGRLQPLVDDHRVENIIIIGHDRVFLELTDGRRIPGPPVADSDEELTDFLTFLASRSEVNARPFSPSQPRLHLRLDGGARLAAVAWITPRPSVVIRRHGLREVTLPDLTDRATLTPIAASFLRAAIKARMSVVVSGAQGAGKALALDTPVPTPTGWTTMGALNPGDQVFAEDGNPCTVLAAHDHQYGRPCYQLEFDDGTTVTADADHLWRMTRQTHRAAAHEQARAGRKDEPIHAVDAAVRAELWAFADRVNQEPDRQVTIEEFTREVGPSHRGVLHRQAQQLTPAGHTYPSWNRRDRRPMLTYSRQALAKELAAAHDTPPRRNPRRDSVVLTTSQIAHSPPWAHQDRSRRTHHFAIPTAEPIRYPRTRQPIDPYMLGIWLGDGASATARISTADPRAVAALSTACHPTKIESTTSRYDHRVAGDLHLKLRTLGVLDDKHIPATYLRGSVEQRQALLQGLLDSVATCSRPGTCSFTSTLQALAEQTHELVCSLGYRATLTSKPAKPKTRPVGTAWTVSWTTHDPMFRQPRKRQRQNTSNPGDPHQRYLVAVTQVPSVPVRCITVDAPSSLFLITRSFLATHNTTLVRALCAEIPPREALGTFETEYELHLHELPDRHPIVHAWEARPGSGEIGADGRQAGEFTLDEALYDSHRFALSRQIVGEIRGREVWVMIKAMESGSGSISTTHAANAPAALRKLVTCAMEAGPHVTRQLAISKLAETIDVIVHLHLDTDPQSGGAVRRWVCEVLAVEPSDEPKGYATTRVFAPRPLGPAVADTCPDGLAQRLLPYGFDYAGFLAEAAAHRGAP